MALAATNNAPGVCIEDGKVLRSARLKGIVEAVFSSASGCVWSPQVGSGAGSMRLGPGMCGVAKEHAQEMASAGRVLVVIVMGFLDVLVTATPHSPHAAAAAATAAVTILATPSAAVLGTRMHDGQIVHKLDVTRLTVKLRAKLLGEPFHRRQGAVLPCTERGELRVPR